LTAANHRFVYFALQNMCSLYFYTVVAVSWILP